MSDLIKRTTTDNVSNQPAKHQTQFRLSHWTTPSLGWIWAATAVPLIMM